MSTSGVDDKDRSLLQIRSSRPSKSLISRLIDMQSYQMDQEKSLEFVRKLECLSLSPRKRSHNDQQMHPTVLRRVPRDGFMGDFVALSYTWDPAPGFEKDNPSGGYNIQQRGSYSFEPSTVRNRVFDRSLQYMKYVGAKCLWIDKYCIEQEPGLEKERGMQAMDMVYNKSRYPVALLARPIQSSVELQLLVRILNGEFVRGQKSSSDINLCYETSTAEALQAVKLLKAITDDFWWKRGWTFQENYRAENMRLLMPHSPCLEDQKRYRSSGLFGSLSGELCIESWKFHNETTRLCLAYERRRPPDRGLCQSVITIAPKYTVLLQSQDMYGKTSAPVSMSPRIVMDISARELTDGWDRLPIIANCCQYPVRLDSVRLRKAESSISLSMLGLYLMNGEILSNHPDDAIDATEAEKANIAGLIDLLSYKRLCSPLSQRFLTFNKGCRFNQVKFTRAGLQTEGHVWKIQKLLPTGLFSKKLPWMRPSEELRRRLRQLADVLDDNDEMFLSLRLNQFLQDDYVVGPQKTFTKKWLDTMAKYLVSAIEEGKPLYIGHLVDDTWAYPSNGAIFVAEDVTDDDIEDESLESCEDFPSQDSSSIGSDLDDVDTNSNDTEEPGDKIPRYVFTSLWPEKFSGEVDHNDVDHHVSMVVDCPDVRAMVPRLFTKQWIHGLCFFDSCPRQDVLFPWPPVFDL